MRLCFPAALVLLSLCPDVQAQPAPAAPCQAPEASQLDLWTGTWALTWPAGTNGPTDPGRGTNTVTREMNGCVVREQFADETGYRGLSVSVYAPGPGRWRQTWVDNQGGYIALTGGQRPDGTMELRTEPFTTPQGQHQINRMIWTDVTADALTWRWQRSLDDGQTWADQWVIHYTRR